MSTVHLIQWVLRWTLLALGVLGAVYIKRNWEPTARIIVPSILILMMFVHTADEFLNWW